MSTYQTAESALLTLIRAYSGGTVYTTTTSSADDWRVLDNATSAAVVEMAGPTIEGMTAPVEYGVHGEYQETHQIGIWICEPRGVGAGGDGAIKQALKARTEAVKDYLRPFRRLNNASGVRSAQIVRTTAPAYISPTTDAAMATHVAQQIIVQVACESAEPAGESDG